MSSYADLDEMIDSWVKATGSTLFTDWAGAPARFVYVPGDLPFDCFQVSVGAPVNGLTTVTARAVDTNNNTEEQMEQTWEGAADELSDMLQFAMDAIERWKLR